MADNVETSPQSGGAVFATDDIGGVNHPYVKVEFGADNAATPVEDADGKRLPVNDPQNGVLLGAKNETAPASDTASAGLNGRLQRIAQRISALIALVPTALTGSGNFKVSIEENNAGGAGDASEATLATRLSETDFDDKTGAKNESAPASDTASSGLNGRLQRIAQRLSSILGVLPAALTGGGNLKVSIQEDNSTPALPAGAATETTLATLLTQSDFDTLTGAKNETAPASDTASSGLNGRLQRIAQRVTSLIALVPAALTGSGNFKVSVQESAVDPATQTTLATRLSESDFDAKTGALTETAPASDTASSGLNGRLQRVAQRLSALIALVPTALTGSGNFKVSVAELSATLTLPTGASTEATLATRLSESDFDTKTGGLTETAPASDTASSGLNGRLQRVAQRLSSLIALVPAALTGSGNFKVSLAELTATLTLPTGASTETTLGTRLSESDFDTKTGSLTETAPASDTASSGLNGRLQRIAQRLSTIIGLIPTALTGSGNFKVAIQEAITLTVNAHAVTNAGTFAVQDSEKVADDAAFTAGTTKVQPVGFFADESSTDSVDENDIGAPRMTLDRKVIATIYGHAAAGGASLFKNLDVDESEDDIKTTPGKLFWLHAINLTSAPLYLKFYNDTAANVVVGTTVPVLTLVVPTLGTTNGAGFTVHFGDMGAQFTVAISIAATTGLADNNTGAPATNALVVNGGYT